jgi:hypothetical protein
MVRLQWKLWTWTFLVLACSDSRGVVPSATCSERGYSTCRQALVCGQARDGVIQIRRPNRRGCPKNDAHIDYPAGWGGKADGELLWAAPGNDQGSCASRTISFEAAEQAFVGLVGGVGVAG